MSHFHFNNKQGDNLHIETKNKQNKAFYNFDFEILICKSAEITTPIIQTKLEQQL